jgi:hypothetical protein
VLIVPTEGMAGLYIPLSTLRRHPHGGLRMTRGRCDSLRLHRSGLAPPTPCRPPGALHRKALLFARLGKHPLDQRLEGLFREWFPRFRATPPITSVLAGLRWPKVLYPQRRSTSRQSQLPVCVRSSKRPILELPSAAVCSSDAERLADRRVNSPCHLTPADLGQVKCKKMAQA